MSSKINYVLCRCCASEGTFKDLSTKYHWMGEVEIYADMLKDCFDVHLSSSVDSEEGGICEVCITQLRNAANFKKQVLHTEKLFIKRLQEKLYDTDAVKVEVSPLNDDLESDHVTEEFPEYEVPIKEEQQEAKPRKRAAKLAASRPKRSKADPGDTKRDADYTTRVKIDADLKSEDKHLHLPGITIRKLSSDKKGKDNAIKKTATSIMSDQTEFKKQLHNIKQILLNSNATPIKSYSKFGYYCNFCPEHFTKPTELKLHTLSNHEDVEGVKFVKATLSHLIVKLDITDLKCFLCNDAIESLQQLVDHLQNDHDKHFYTDINNHILPFKFGEDPNDFRCVLCPNVYKRFKQIQEHMGVHYPNYTCDVCSSTFVNKNSLKCHMERHERGEYRCRFCPKVFNTHINKCDHERRIHIDGDLRNKCPHCPARFGNYNKRNEHVVKEHGAQPVTFDCLACDKVFNTKVDLTMHTKRDHLMERTHQCSECKACFFSRKCLKMHMYKHSGVKEFKCQFCFKSFARKNTLKQHLRIHLNDRRYKCGKCAQTFIQKCSYQKHMCTKHGDADVTTRVRVSDPVVNTGGNLLHLPEMTIRKLGSNKKGEYNEKNAVNIKADRVELEKHIHNIEQILQNSNATPIKFHSSLGYSCNFCPKHYTKPAELKLHTLAKHENVENLRFAKGTLASLVVKLDITDLKCFLCRKHIESLQEFVDHLQCDHSKKIYTDINNHILPFKFSDDPNHFECVLCRDVFKSFKLTQEHMHIHYTNYTCDICNSTYVNKLCLKYHVERHMQVSSKKGKGSENIAINRDNYIMADQVEFKKHLHNIKQILNNSNATPVKAYTSLGYFCNFCPENFKKPADLKLHTLDNHKNIGKLKFTKGGMSYHLVKLDITDLKCFLCQNDIESLQQLVDHLQNDHDKHYYTDINNHILPFKFGADPNDFRCVLCPNVYKHFKQVQEHMGVHYPNYTCDVCSCMFVSKSSLQRHAERHEQGQHECSFCPKVFSSHGNKYDHERRVHKSGNLRNKCPHCPARFICYNQRNRHMVKEHGAQPVTFDCLACDKVFPSRKHLTKHTKRDHLMERRHQCQECQARFFAAKDLKKHIYTHTGVKDHKCEVCLKEFALKVNLRTHMRIHSNDRRFKCRSCGQTFIHKCSYRNHMRTQHDEVV
ncbi:zinc finger protein 569-like isoform X2 [Plodia interpunctella]|uniref:zinc finger protein 569-like isoform X2 n=1 Tax=Plodia interpunctella TaxID=58824 RepID=UPI003100C996